MQLHIYIESLILKSTLGVYNVELLKQPFRILKSTLLDVANRQGWGFFFFFLLFLEVYLVCKCAILIIKSIFESFQYFHGVFAYGIESESKIKIINSI